MNKKQKQWMIAGLWLLFIYATLPLARSISGFLREAIPFSAAINAGIFLTVTAILIFVLIERINHDLLNYLLLTLILIAGGLIVCFIKIPEEKIHFLQYGVLSFLILRALNDEQPRAKHYLLAFILTAGCGWLDEGIQHLLPQRYYDLRDILFNAGGGFLGLLFSLIAKRRRNPQR